MTIADPLLPPVDRGANPPASHRVFNHACFAVALAWLVGFVCAGALRMEGHRDIAQYYMGGAMVARGEAEALYPIPTPGSTENAGFKNASVQRPAYARLAQAQGIAHFNRFVYLPPSALLFAPLGALDYGHARTIWIFVLGVCAWVVCLLAARIDRLVGGESRRSGLLAIAIACSPLVYRAIRSGNVSPLVAAALGLAALALFERRSGCASAALAMGGLFKGTSMILLPLAIVLRRWRTLVGLAGVTALVVAASIAVLGVEPYRVYFGEIVPTLGRSFESSGNQSIAGLLRRLGAGEALSPGVRLGLRLAALGTLAALTALMLRRRSLLETSAPHFFAAVAGLVSIVLIFSPLAWVHYHLYACPLWGWVLWEARRGRARAWLAWLALGLVYVPVGVVDTLPLAEPVRSHLLLGALVLLALSVARLATTARPGGEPVRP